jgi:hypothetical protein
VPEKMLAGPKHRYSFDGDASDSVGGAHGNVVNPSGNFASFTNVPGQLDLRAHNGENSNQAVFTNGAYVDLPNGIISALGAGGPAQATFEAWVTVETNRPWARVFDFGRSDGPEDTAGGAPNSNYLFMAPQSGSGNARFAHRANPGAGFTESLLDDGRAFTTGVEHHLAVVWDEVAHTQTFYVDGQRLFAYDGANPTNDLLLANSNAILNGISLGTLQDMNNWLGRAQWGDPLFDGLFNEFRIYNSALTAGQVYGNYLAGPNVVNAIPEPSSFALASLAALTMFGAGRRRCSR